MAIVTLVRPRFGVRSTHMVERNLLVYRRTFMVIFSGFFEPLFYLFSMGFGVGSLVGNVPLDNGTQVPYAVFVAPALLASSSMNGAIYETAHNFFFKLKYAKLYDAVIATPMSLTNVARGEATWALLRGSLYAVGFVAVIGVVGLTGLSLISWPMGLLAFPAAMVVGFGFAGAGMAATTFVKRWQDFDYLELAIMPMFLFSGTFYPISIYPPLLQAVIEVTPLYRGVHLLRALMTATPDAIVLVDLAYMVAMGMLGLAVSARRLQKLLTS
jgi:lipooligosaccharide transport system permease protein